MRRVLLIARQAYLHEVRRKSFLVAALAPIGLVVLTALLVVFVTQQGASKLPLGYVDPGGLLKPAVLSTMGDADELTAFRAYESEEQARAALEVGDIQAYYLVPADFGTALTLKACFLEKWPSDRARSDMNRFLRASLLADLDPAVRQRAAEGITLTLRTSDGRRSMDMSNPVAFMLPFLSGILFVITVMMSAGYLLQAVTAEKENRTMEMVITSVSPEQLISGKALGLVGVSLTELGIWLVTIVVGILIARPFVAELRNVGVPWDLVGIAALYFLPSFVLVAGIMITIGGLAPDYRQGQQVAGSLNLLFVAPLLVSTLLFINPDSPVLVAMTLFPTTAFAMVTMRWSFTVVPIWQLVLSWSLLVATATAAVLFAARVFRLGMLRYGQPMSLAKAVSALRTRRPRSEEARHA